jgi:hypothetical protein
MAKIGKAIVIIGKEMSCARSLEFKTLVLTVSSHEMMIFKTLLTFCRRSRTVGETVEASIFFRYSSTCTFTHSDRHDF